MHLLLSARTGPKLDRIATVAESESTTCSAQSQLSHCTAHRPRSPRPEPAPKTREWNSHREGAPLPAPDVYWSELGAKRSPQAPNAFVPELRPETITHAKSFLVCRCCFALLLASQRQHTPASSRATGPPRTTGLGRTMARSRPTAARIHARCVD